MASSDGRRFIQNLHPLVRATCVLALVLSFALARDPTASLVALAALALGALLVDFRGTTRLVFGVLLPFAACSAIVAVVISSGDGPIPAELQWSAYAGRFARISAVSVAVWCLVGLLTPTQLYHWLTWFRLPRSVALQLTSPLVLIEALARRVVTIRDARLVQGCAARRGLLANARQLLPVLNLLVAAGLAMAVDRGDIWQRDDIAGLIAAYRPPPAESSLPATLLAVASCAVIAAINLGMLPLR